MARNTRTQDPITPATNAPTTQENTMSEQHAFVNPSQPTPVPTAPVPGEAVVTWGDYKVELAKIPTGNLAILAMGGLKHKMSNEVDATVNALVRKELGLPASNPNGTSEAEKLAIRNRITAWRTEHKDDTEKLLKTARDEMWNDIISGTIGMRRGGPRKDELTVEYTKQILARAKQIYVGKLDYFGNPTKWPADDTTVVVFKGPTGEQLPRTRPVMLGNVEKMEGEKLMESAKQVIAMREAAAGAQAAADQVEEGY